MIIQRKELERIKEGANLPDFDGLFAFPLQCAHLRSFEGQEAFAFSPSVPFDLGRGVFTVGHPSWRKRHGY